MHGLKKGGLRRLGESNVTTHELLSVSGHRTLAQLQVYTEELDPQENGRQRDRETHQERELANLATRDLQTTAQTEGK